MTSTKTAPQRFGHGDAGAAVQFARERLPWAHGPEADDVRHEGVGRSEFDAPDRGRTLLRLPEVKARTGLARSTIYVRLDQGCFPRPVSLGSRAVGWIEREVDEWMRERIEESRDDGA